MKKLVTLIILVGVITSCSSLKTAVFDQYAYRKTIDVKVESRQLISKATMPFSDFEPQVENLRLDLEKILLYEQNRSNNEISYAMWQILADEDKNLLAGFLKRWENESTLGQGFVSQAEKQIMEAFDVLLRYEGVKDPQAKATLQSKYLINQ